MNSANVDKAHERDRRRFGWIFEIAIVASVVQAIAYTILSLSDLPIA